MGQTGEGKIHDIEMFRQDELDFPKGSKVHLDLGYYGFHQEEVLIEMPHKKPKNGALTPIQKAENTQKSAVHILVEHAISGIKRLRIVLDRCRLKTEDVKDQVMRIATGLHNLRVKMRYQNKTMKC